MLNPEELDAVDDFRFKERIRYRPLTTPKGGPKPMSTPCYESCKHSLT